MTRATVTAVALEVTVQHRRLAEQQLVRCIVLSARRLRQGQTVKRATSPVEVALQAVGLAGGWERTIVAKGNLHVSKQGSSNWKVSQNGERLSTHQTQRNAIERATQHARQDRVDVVTHGRVGKFRSKDSYGNDPLPPRDRER